MHEMSQFENDRCLVDCTDKSAYIASDYGGVTTIPHLSSSLPLTSPLTFSQTPCMQARQEATKVNMLIFDHNDEGSNQGLIKQKHTKNMSKHEKPQLSSGGEGVALWCPFCSHRRRRKSMGRW